MQRLADRISAYFVPAVVLTAAFAFVFWFYVFHRPFDFSLMIAVSVLVISCPCALGLATPTAVVIGIGKGAEKGILIKSGAVLESAGRVDMVVFDKTGTLTAGKPAVSDVVPSEGMEAGAVLALAAGLEQFSEHPLAEAINIYAREKDISVREVSGFTALPGLGVSGRVGGERVLLGNRNLMEKEGINLSGIDKKTAALEKEGKTASILASGGKALGVIAVADTLKDSSKKAVDGLKALGIEVCMVTGDNKRTAEAIAGMLGIEQVFSEALPEDKAGYVAGLQGKGKTVAAVGDGINDAPALAQADVGIAMSSGTDVAIESGGIILMKNDPIGVVSAVRLSRQTMAKIRQNMFWALFYNSLGIPVAAGVLYPYTGWLLSPIIAGGAMALSSVSVVTNSLMLGYKKI